jgi:acyl-coenzyme A synthetase/AMP-(fatty) acid ligase
LSETSAEVQADVGSATVEHLLRPALRAGSWNGPRTFNFTRDVVGALAAHDRKTQALVTVDDLGVVYRSTFGDLATMSARWANLLAGRGVTQGDRILVFVGETPAWHAIVLAGIQLGAVVVPTPRSVGGDELAFRARHAATRVIVASRATASTVEAIRVGLDPETVVLYLEDAQEDLRKCSTLAPFAQTHADDVAFILYTQGTTGGPRGVMHTHAATFATRAHARHMFSARAGDLVWCTAATGSPTAIWNSLLGPWSCGAAVLVKEGSLDAHERLELIERLGVTTLCHRPSEYALLSSLGEHGQHDLSHLRRAASFGGAVGRDVHLTFGHTFGITIREGYGQTESPLMLLNETRLRPGSIGRRVPGHEVEVIDADGAAIGSGAEGDIALRGIPPTLFAGYWPSPGATGASARDVWHLTGDRGRKDDEGFFWFAGRTADQVSSGGQPINPIDVERVLGTHPAVAESAVIATPESQGGVGVKAFVVLAGDYEPTPELAAELLEHGRAELPSVTDLTGAEFVDALPKTADGEVRRSEFRLLEQWRSEAAGHLATDDERRVSEQLRVEAVEKVRRDADAAIDRAEDHARQRLEQARLRALEMAAQRDAMPKLVSQPTPSTTGKARAKAARRRADEKARRRVEEIRRRFAQEVERRELEALRPVAGTTAGTGGDDTKPDTSLQLGASLPTEESTSQTERSTATPRPEPTPVRPAARQSQPRTTLGTQPSSDAAPAPAGKARTSKTAASKTTPSKTTPSKTTPSKTTPSKTAPSKAKQRRSAAAEAEPTAGTPEGAAAPAKKTPRRSAATTGPRTKDATRSPRTRTTPGPENEKAVPERSRSATLARKATPPDPGVAQAAFVAFAPTVKGYELVECEGPLPAPGDRIRVPGYKGTLVVTRVGASPLPLDPRTCAYLEDAAVASKQPKPTGKRSRSTTAGKRPPRAS